MRIEEMLIMTRFKKIGNMIKKSIWRFFVILYYPIMYMDNYLYYISTDDIEYENVYEKTRIETLQLWHKY